MTNKATNYRAPSAALISFPVFLLIHGSLPEFSPTSGLPHELVLLCLEQFPPDRCHFIPVSDQIYVERLSLTTYYHILLLSIPLFKFNYLYIIYDPRHIYFQSTCL
jgi:hypothetical protein